MKKSRSSSMFRFSSLQAIKACLIGVWLVNSAYGQTTAPHSSAAAGPVDALQAWPESDTVRELLRSDAAAALAAQRYQKAEDWIQSAKPLAERATAPGGEKTDALRVKAIYGVGKTLQAELAINGQVLRSRPGQCVHDTYETAAYLIVAIEGSCVRWRRGNETKTTCLNRAEQP